MKYTIQFIFVLLILCSSIHTASSQVKWPGFLISTEGDTIIGTIKPVKRVDDLSRIQHFELEFPDGSKKTWGTKDVARFGIDRLINSERRRDHFYAKVWPHNELRVFLHPLLDGKAQLYLVPDPEKARQHKVFEGIVYGSDPDEDESDTYYISFPNTEFIIRLEPENYETALKQFLRKCPELTEQIGKKKFRFRNLEHIITYYNQDCNGG